MRAPVPLDPCPGASPPPHPTPPHGPHPTPLARPARSPPPHARPTTALPPRPYAAQRARCGVCATPAKPRPPPLPTCPSLQTREGPRRARPFVAPGARPFRSAVLSQPSFARMRFDGGERSYFPFLFLFGFSDLMRARSEAPVCACVRADGASRRARAPRAGRSWVTRERRRLVSKPWQKR